MSKFFKIGLVGFVGLAIAALVVIFLLSRAGVSFERVELPGFSMDQERFRVDERLQKLYFKKGGEETWLEDLPTIKGYPWYLKGRKSFVIIPGLSGEVGFYTYLHLDNLNRKGGIRFSLQVDRNGKSQRVGQVRARKYSRPFFTGLDLNRGDRLVLKFEGWGLVFFSQPIVYRKKKPEECRNIFLIGVDTLRWDQVGTRVGGKPLTPHIDEFIKDSVVFKNAYAQSSWTLPSFMSLFTGLYEYHHRVDIHRPLEPSMPGLMPALSKKFITFGCHSGMVMKKRWGFCRGFDYYKQVPFTNPLFPKAGQTLFREAIMLLESAGFPDFFFFLHTYQVHDPYTPPKDFLYQLNPHARFLKLDVVNQRAPWKTFQPVADELRKSLKELYQAEVLAFDRYFGEFRKKLEELNLYDNAMIIFMSDHGEEFFEHRGWAHSHSLYNELIKVPLIIKFPGSEFKGTQVEDTVGVIDIMPTLLSNYRVEYDQARIDGLDLMPLIRGERGAYQREYLISSIAESRYIEQIPPKLAVLYGDYKIIYNDEFSEKDLQYFKPYGLPPRPPRIEVYGLKDDPEDRHNRAREKHDLIKRVMPIIMEIKTILKKNLLQKKKGRTELDDEARKQLESLGYI